MSGPGTEGQAPRLDRLELERWLRVSVELTAPLLNPNGSWLPRR